MLKLKELRARRNLSQDEMAKDLGISKKTLSNYETGRTVPSDDKVRKICKVYGVSREWLTGEDPESRPAVRKTTASEVEGKKAAGTASFENQPEIVIQAQMGGSITAEEILARVYSQEPTARKIYVKPEENKAYWVSEKNRGYIVLWE